MEEKEGKKEQIFNGTFFLNISFAKNCSDFFRNAIRTKSYNFIAFIFIQNMIDILIKHIVLYYSGRISSENLIVYFCLVSMAKKYSLPELISFFKPSDPPENFGEDCPIFSAECHSPLDFEELSKIEYISRWGRQRDGENNMDFNQNPNNQEFQPQAIINFKPIHLPNEKKQNETSTSDFKPAKIENNNEPNSIQFKPNKIENKNEQKIDEVESAAKSFKPIKIENAQKNNENKNEPTIKSFHPKRIETEQTTSTLKNPNNNEKNTKMKNTINFEQIKKQMENQQVINTYKEALSEEPKPKPFKVHAFAPKKASQLYDGPELQTNTPQTATTNKTINFADIEKSEKSTQNEKEVISKQTVENNPKKGLFESLVEQEKKESLLNRVNTVNNDEDVEPVKPVRNLSFKPKPSKFVFEGAKIDVQQNNDIAHKKTSGFGALLESEKEKHNKEMEALLEKEKQIELQKKVQKPSIIDMIIAEEKSKSSQIHEQDTFDEEEEVKHPIHSFKPSRQTHSYDGVSVEETVKPKAPKAPSFADILSDQIKNNEKSETLENQQNASKQQAPEYHPVQKTGPSFSELLSSEKKTSTTQKPNTNSNNGNKEETSQEPLRKGFNPKKKVNSFSDLINNEQKANMKQSSEFSIPTTINYNTNAKKKGLGQSFAQLMEAEVHREEVANENPMKINQSANNNFLQKIEEEEIKSKSDRYVASIGDFIGSQGIKSNQKKKKNTGRRGDNNKGNDNNSDLFWGSLGDPTSMADLEKAMDENFPSLEQSGFKQNLERYNTADSQRSSKIEWLSRIITEETGESDPREFAESLIDHSKSEMIRYLTTLTFDQVKSKHIADKFFKRFPM